MTYEENLPEVFFLGNAGLGVRCTMVEHRDLLLQLVATKEWRRFRTAELTVQMTNITEAEQVARVASHAIEFANAEAEMIQAAARIIQQFETRR